MTVEQIKKGLRCHGIGGSKNSCYECPYRNIKNCHDVLANDALALVNTLEKGDKK